MNKNMAEARLALYQAFPGGYTTEKDEFIAHKASNTYIILANCTTPEEIAHKVLMWFSRPAYKGRPYQQEWRNKAFRRFMLDGINRFLETSFSEIDIAEIYHYLGNAARPDLTAQFVRNGCSINWLLEKVATEDKKTAELEEDVTQTALRFLAESATSDYALYIWESIRDRAIEDVMQSSEFSVTGNYSDSDVKLAIGRTILGKIGFSL